MKICYFGIYNSDFGRNKIYIKALRKAGHQVIECQDHSPGFLKYLNLYKKHKIIKNDYDAMIVGYPGHIVTPLAKLISNKKVIVDALGSIYDAEFNSHNPNLFRLLKSQIADWLMFIFADKILLESNEQKKYFEYRFGDSKKYEILYTGVDEDVFKYEYKKEFSEKFIVLFRGKLTPESGIQYILDCARILKNNNKIKFKIIGSGYLLEKSLDFIKNNKLENVELVSEYLSEDQLIKNIKESDLALGQFENNLRLNRTLPHKAFEAFASGIPYLTGDALAIREITENNKNAFWVSIANPLEMAKLIENLSTNKDLLNYVSINARKLYDDKFSFNRIVESLSKIML